MIGAGPKSRRKIFAALAMLGHGTSLELVTRNALLHPAPRLIDSKVR